MADDSLCTVEKIHALQAGVCQYVDENCTAESLVRFSYFYFCQVSENILVLDILTVLVPVMAFHLLSSTAENFLSPALAQLAQIFKLSQTVAGVTLLALGNGAPDVITAAVAGGSDDGGISIAIGSIFGAGLFVTTATLASVIHNGKSIKIERKTFIRDTIFYFTGSCIVLIFAILNKVYLFMSIGFMMIYVVFLGIVIYQDRQETRNLKEIGVDQQTEEDSEHLKLRKGSVRRAQSVGIVLENPPSLTDLDQNYYESNTKMQLPFMEHEESSCSQDDINGEDQEEDASPTKQAIQKKVKLAKTAIKMRIRFKYLRHEIKQKYYDFKGEFREMGMMDRITYIYEIPVDFIREITIPPASDEQWNKWRAMLCCLTSPAAFLFMIGSIEMAPFGVDNFYLIYLLLGIGFIGAILVWKYSHFTIPPTFNWIFSLLAFVMSVCYISQIAQILIDFITFFQILTNVNKTFLGMTLLAYGNSSGDFFTNSQLAKMGFGVMAVTGCFAGQLFNLLIGFGFALILQTKSGPYEFGLFTGGSLKEWISNGIAIAILVLTIFSTFLTFIFSKKFNYKFESGKFSDFLLTYYGISISICLTLCIVDQFIS